MLAGDYLRKSEYFGGKFPKKGAETKQIFQSNAQVYSQTRKNFAPNAQVSVRNVQKRLKIFENCIETFENYTETFENIRKYSKIFHPPAHLIDFAPLAAGVFLKAKINQKSEALNSKFETNSNYQSGYGLAYVKTRIRNSKQKLATKIAMCWRRPQRGTLVLRRSEATK